MLKTRLLKACVLLGALIPVGLMADVTLYNESFTPITAVDSPMSDVGWYGHHADGTWINSNVDEGAPTHNSYLLAGGGYGLWVPNEDHILSWTEEFSFDPALYLGDGLRFEWSFRNNSATQTAHLAIRIGSDWYASDASFNDTDGNTTWNVQTLNFTTTGADWHAVTFDGTTAVDGDSTVGLSMDAGTLGTDLPAGSITAFGLYMMNNGLTSGNLRYDDFQVIAVPEPATFAFLGGLIALGFILVRRHRR